MSFYFMHKELILLNINLFLKRVEKLLIPYLIWPIIIFNLNNYFLNKFIKLQIIYSFKDLKNQLIWGNSFFNQFWFQWDLIILTILFVIIIALSIKNHLFFIQIFAFFSYILQYSGINKKFYNSLSGSKNEPLGRLNEMISFAASGFTLASLEIIKALQKNKIKTMIFSVLIFISLEIYPVFSILNGGIAYPGIILNIRSICLIFAFSLFPSEKINSLFQINIQTYWRWNFIWMFYYIYNMLYNFIYRNKTYWKN